MSSPAELHRRAVDAINALDWDLARRTLAAASDAATAACDHDLLARIDGSRAYLLSLTDDPIDAERVCRAALDRTGLTDSTRALLSGQLGTLLLHAGRLDDAAPLLTAGIDGSDGVEAGNLLMNRSIVRMQQHRFADAAADLERAVALFDAAQRPDAVAEARHNLGYTALLRGDLVAALQLMSSAREELAGAGDLALAIADQDRAEVLRDAGLTTEAEELLRGVAARFGAQGMRQSRAEAELHLARSLLSHDPAEARTIARAAGRRFRALGSTGWAARADAVVLEARLLGPRRPSADDLRATARELTRSGYRTEAAGLHLAVGLVDASARLPAPTTDDPMPLRLRAVEVRAHRAERRGHDARVRRLADDGLEMLTGWQRSFGALDLQASIAMHGRGLVTAGLRAAARSGDPRVLFSWSERARHLSQRVAPVRPPQDAGTAADLAELRMLRAELAGADWVTDARVKRLRDRVRRRQWSGTGSSGMREHIDLDTLQGLLPDGTAALAYVYTGEDLLCVTITADDVRRTRLDLAAVHSAADGLRADLDVAAISRGGTMAAVVQRSLDARLARLDSALLAPALPDDANRVVLTAPGLLGGLPWAMLPRLADRAFTLATSASRWAEARGPRHAPTAVGFAAGPRVPRAAEELSTAASAWTATAVDGHVPTVLRGEHATVDAVTDLAADVDLLHIAAHGRHAVDNPLFAGFELADGTLFGYDVDRIGRAPATVVLSACELGRSTVRWGEEALGMTRVWLHAGSQAVIAAPVVVADDLACELLGAVHDGLSRGETPADALAAASASTGHRTPFQVHGNGF